MLERIAALLLYPGLLFALALAALFVWLTKSRLSFGRGFRAATLLSLDGAAALASLLLVALALALLPWPYHPAAGWALIGNPLVLWCALEGAFLLPILPALIAAGPLAVRAAIREAQVGAAGRCVFWLSVGVGLWAGVGWSLVALPGRLLLGLAGLLALPAAIGAGPFGAELSLSAAGAEEGLDEGTASLVRLARHVRGAALLAALVVAMVPSAVPPAPLQIQPWSAALLIGALFIALALLLRQASAVLPRLTLPAALRWCWWRALPFALAGMIYLAVV